MTLQNLRSLKEAKQAKKIAQHLSTDAGQLELILQTSTNKLQRAAAGVKLIESTVGVQLYLEQIQAGMLASENNAIEMETGAGKTLAIILTALLMPKPVLISTVTETLALRDAQLMQKVLKGTSMTVRANTSGGTKDLESVYSATFVYSPSDQIMFDSLQLPRVSTSYSYIIDELDYVLMDNARSSFGVSGEGLADGIADSIESHATIPTLLLGGYKMLFSLVTECIKDFVGEYKHQQNPVDLYSQADYVVYPMDRQLCVTARGEERLKTTAGKEPYVFILQVATALLKLKCLLTKDVDYTIEDNRIIWINRDNGCYMPNTKMDFYTQFAAEYTNEVALSQIPKLSDITSYQMFYAGKKRICGFSGTLKECREELLELYLFKDVIEVPSHFKCVRRDAKIELLPTQQEAQHRVTKILRDNTENPALIVCNSESEAKQLYAAMQSNEIEQSREFRLVLDNGDKSRLIQKDISNQAVISTVLAGRGVDIPAQSKPLIVILFGCLTSNRAIRQARGRTARQGAAGDTFTIWFKDDCELKGCKKRTLRGIRDYLSKRAKLDESTRRNLFYHTQCALEIYNQLQRASEERALLIPEWICSREETVQLLESIPKSKKLKEFRAEIFEDLLNRCSFCPTRNQYAKITEEGKIKILVEIIRDLRCD